MSRAPKVGVSLGRSENQATVRGEWGGQGAVEGWGVSPHHPVVHRVEAAMIRVKQGYGEGLCNRTNRLVSHTMG